METTQKFLSFNLGLNDTAVISLQNITEILQVSLAQICSVPEMPNCVLGIYNWRGEMLWLINLEEMLGYTPLLNNSHTLSEMMAIVLENEGQYLGIVVRQIIDIELLDIKQMKDPSPELFYPAMSPFLQGYFIKNPEELLFNLDALKILQAPLWRIHN